MKKRMKGLTLVEMMVATSLGVLLIASVMGLLLLGRDVWQDTETKMITLQQVRGALTEIGMDLPRTSRRPAAQGGPPLDLRIATDGSWIRFYIPQSITDGTITWGDEIRYRFIGANHQILRENLTTGETRAVANFIDTATFGILDAVQYPNVVAMTIRSGKTSLSRRVFETELQTNYTVRN
ncbi:MAG: hypothetical protein ABH845_04765 [Candidatus Omnitrophota bacterium]